ncbi:glycoside hydrolase family 95 protein [Undibacterium sp. CY18W]|uniref:Glycoside hydrolase family 95 protein n=2 Tax=Undibacterium hunanense TaxID=2762292 RepID=A0ABR6ZQY9_9BURK|nr:glycoside hydrolase family 95 protein [Undibacterium hunanense]
MAAAAKFNRSRRNLMLGMAGLVGTPSLVMAQNSESGKSTNTLWYRQPASCWEEALPLGNGRLGAMVFGRVGQERLQLNEDTLWAGAPYTPDNPDARAALPEVRQLIADGKYKEATDLASTYMMGNPLKLMPYGSLGDVLLTLNNGAVQPTRYERQLDLSTAINLTSFQTADGVFERETFVSAQDQVIVMHMTAEQARLGIELAYRSPRKVKYPSSDYQGADGLTKQTPVDWLKTELAGELSAGSTMAADGKDAILITGSNEPGAGGKSGLRYALRIKLVSDGRLDLLTDTMKNNRMTVSEARTVTLLIAAATSYVNYHDVSGDPVAIVRRQTEQAATKPYELLKSNHIRDHRVLFNNMSINLGSTTQAAQATDIRIAAAETTEDPALSALYVQYARYLMISSSRPGTQPANLQGIWNEGTNPPWGSKYTININTQMNYWPADPAGLGACVEPLLRLVEDLAVTGAKTARTMYNASGWVTHHNTDLWRAASPNDGPRWGLWPCGGAWLCNSVWDHYDYSRDADVLTRLFPVMLGASAFFLDTLIEDPKGRGLVTSPSLSPENSHPFGTSVCAAPAMDRQIVRDLFKNTLEAARLLKQQPALIERIARALPQIASDRIGHAGQLQEWLDDWDTQAPDQRHRHVSHLYAVYPSNQINLRDTPDLLQAAKNSLRQRGDLATGWGTAWRICLWARMGEGDHAHSILKTLTGPKRTYPNMFDAHPPFQIDGNFGGSAGVLEMLLQSWGGEVFLLPALPAAWPSGEVTGLRARGGMSVDMQWRAGKLVSATLQGLPGTSARVSYRGVRMDVSLDAKGIHRLKIPVATT